MIPVHGGCTELAKGLAKRPVRAGLCFENA